MKYRKTALVEAIQWTGRNSREICDFVGKQLQVTIPPSQMQYEMDCPNDAFNILIPTLEGDLIASRMDWILKGINGECWPCKPDIFEKTYEKID